MEVIEHIEANDRWEFIQDYRGWYQMVYGPVSGSLPAPTFPAAEISDEEIEAAYEADLDRRQREHDEWLDSLEESRDDYA